MTKFVIRALAVAVLMGTAAPAFADYYDYTGRLHCTFGWHYEYDAYGNPWYVCN
jgi:hypothetical protein